ncbi:hypothetical protein HYR69_04940 [Candidatus Sumerlaeota bacterium]|nr:hypothetical protein [Candidatus Sumerlaeota bacterium]
MTDLKAIMSTLCGSGVEFIVVGGIAANFHGSARFTQDVDIVYRRTRENFEKLAAALDPLSPYLRGAPPGLPFKWDADTLERGLNFTLTTTMGDLDVLGEIAGGGGYDQILPHSIEVEILGHQCRCLDLLTLIRVKRAAGRVKDLEAIAELEALWEEKQQRMGQ